MRRRDGRPRVVPALAWVVAAGLFAGCSDRPAKELAEATAEKGTPPARPEPRRTPIEVAYGETAEHTLAGGECHVLELEIEADRYIEVEVEQRGLDLFTTLEPPGGQALFFDSPTRSWGSELVVLVTERTGPHRVEVCAFERVADPTPYGLRVAMPKEPSVADRALARGFHRYSDGHRREQDGDRRAAVTAFEMALRDFQEAGARGPRAWVHYRLGTLARSGGDLEGAELHFGWSARIHRELGDPRQEAFVLSHLGPVQSGLFRLEEARETHRRSLQLAQRAGDLEVVRRALFNLGIVHEQLGETLQAVELYQRREALAQAEGDLAAEWWAMTRIGTVYLEAGDDIHAQRIFEEALAFARRHRLGGSVTTSLQDLGRVYVDREKPREALSYFEQALERVKSSSPSSELAAILNNLGRCYRRLGERQRALELFDRALRALPSGDANARLLEGMILVNLASLHILEGDFEAAAEPSGRALEVYRAAGSPILTTGALKSVAEVEAARGNLDQAAAYLQEIVETVETRRSRSALQRLRATLLEDRYFYWEFYVEVLLRLHERHPESEYAQRAFEVVERAKARILMDELAGTEADMLATAAPEAVARTEALELQMSKLQGLLLRELARKGEEARAQAIERRLRGLEAEHALATARIFADYPGWSAVLESEPVTLETIQGELLDDGETQLVSFLLGDEQSSAWIVGRDSLRVEALPGRERIDRLAREAAELLQKSDQPHLETQARLTSETLSREVLAPLLPHLSARKLLLVKDGALHYVPFAALPLLSDGRPRRAAGERLLDRFDVVDVPSASAAVALRNRRFSGRSVAGDLAVLADPVFEPADERVRQPGRLAVARDASAGSRHRRLFRATRGLGLGELVRLDGTLEEARRISDLVPPDRRLVALGFDANRELLLGGRLARYRILHLAGHGLAHPELTGLVLSLFDPEGRPVDGLIRPYELFGTELSAELVVLSACSTGLGDEIRGEGLLGLSRGFLYAGASQVLASLWDVDDRATAELMERFYVAVLRDGDPPARALRKAQLSLRQEPAWVAPHYWAGFVLQGDGS